MKKRWRLDPVTEALAFFILAIAAWVIVSSASKLMSAARATSDWLVAR